MRCATSLTCNHNSFEDEFALAKCSECPHTTVLGVYPSKQQKPAFRAVAASLQPCKIHQKHLNGETCAKQSALAIKISAERSSDCADSRLWQLRIRCIAPEAQTIPCETMLTLMPWFSKNRSINILDKPSLEPEVKVIQTELGVAGATDSIHFRFTCELTAYGAAPRRIWDSDERHMRVVL
jgi:hypothetical protein